MGPGIVLHLGWGNSEHKKWAGRRMDREQFGGEGLGMLVDEALGRDSSL